MSAIFGEHGDQLVPNLFGQLLQLVQCQFFDMNRTVHHFEISAHRKNWSGGVLERWSVGFNTPKLHHSITPFVRSWAAVSVSSRLPNFSPVVGSSAPLRPAYPGKPWPNACLLRTSLATFPRVIPRIPSLGQWFPVSLMLLQRAECPLCRGCSGPHS